MRCNKEELHESYQEANAEFDDSVTEIELSYPENSDQYASWSQQD